MPEAAHWRESLKWLMGGHTIFCFKHKSPKEESLKHTKGIFQGQGKGELPPTPAYNTHTVVLV